MSLRAVRIQAVRCRLEPVSTLGHGLSQVWLKIRPVLKFSPQALRMTAQPLRFALSGLTPGAGGRCGRRHGGRSLSVVRGSSLLLAQPTETGV